MLGWPLCPGSGDDRRYRGEVALGCQTAPPAPRFRCSAAFVVGGQRGAVRLDPGRSADGVPDRPVKHANGILVISLDFELGWGIRTPRTFKNHREVSAGRSAVPSLLQVFREHQIHATWAVVGFLFFETRKELIASCPNVKPAYADTRFSNYVRLNDIGDNERDDPFHYAPSLIRLIAASPNQEIGTHTFSHYYCLERGQNVRAFQEDLLAAVRAGQKYQLNIQSLVLPRNQLNEEYVSACAGLGIKAYRGNPSNWSYRPSNLQTDQSLFRRGLRLVDAYANICGHHCYSLRANACDSAMNIPASRQLRPYTKASAPADPLRLRRILSDLTWAARRKLVYHLWWHPEDFGGHPQENMAFLFRILNHYRELRRLYGMETLNMGEVVERASNQAESANDRSRVLLAENAGSA